MIAIAGAHIRCIFQKMLSTGTSLAPLSPQRRGLLEATSKRRNVQKNMYYGIERYVFMDTYKWGWFVFITESLLVVLLLTFLGWQSWNTRSSVDIGKKDTSSSVETRS